MFSHLCRMESTCYPGATCAGNYKPFERLSFFLALDVSSDQCHFQHFVIQWEVYWVELSEEGGHGLGAVGKTWVHCSGDKTLKTLNVIPVYKETKVLGNVFERKILILRIDLWRVQLNSPGDRGIRPVREWFSLIGSLTSGGSAHASQQWSGGEWRNTLIHFQDLKRSPKSFP